MIALAVLFISFSVIMLLPLMGFRYPQSRRMCRATGKYISPPIPEEAYSFESRKKRFFSDLKLCLTLLFVGLMFLTLHILTK